MLAKANWNYKINIYRLEKWKKQAKAR